MLSSITILPTKYSIHIYEKPWCKGALIEDINFSIANRVLDKSLILELASLKFIENTNNIIFTGLTGTGYVKLYI